KLVDGGELGGFDAAYVRPAGSARRQKWSGHRAGGSLPYLNEQLLVTLTDQSIEARKFGITADGYLVCGSGPAAIKTGAGRVRLVSTLAAQSRHAGVRW